MSAGRDPEATAKLKTSPRFKPMYKVLVPAYHILKLMSDVRRPKPLPRRPGDVPNKAPLSLMCDV